MNADSSPDAKYSRGRQLLQFDKSHRPAFYGVWPAKRLILLYATALFFLQSMETTFWG